MLDSAPLTIASDQLRAEISPLGAELRRLTTADGKELLSDGDPAFWQGRAPILFPIVGRLRDDRYRLGEATYAMEKHGFARRSTFTASAHTPDTATFTLTDTAESRAMYPFAFALEIGFALSGATLAITATLTNRGDTPMPASFGFHPALRWPLPFGQPRAEHRIRFAQPEPAPIRRIDAYGLLTPASRPTPVVGDTLVIRDDLFVEDAIIFDRLASTSLDYGTDDGPRIGVAFDGLPLLGIWTKRGSAFVCVEPWAGIADPVDFAGDVFDKPGMMTLPPGETRRFMMRLSLVDA